MQKKKTRNYPGLTDNKVTQIPAPGAMYEDQTLYNLNFYIYIYDL